MRREDAAAARNPSELKHVVTHVLIAFALRDNGLIRTSQNTSLMRGESPLQRHMEGGASFQFKPGLNVMRDHTQAHLTWTQQALPEAGQQQRTTISKHQRSHLISKKRSLRKNTPFQRQKNLYGSCGGVKFPMFCMFM